MKELIQVKIVPLRLVFSAIVDANATFIVVHILFSDDALDLYGEFIGVRNLFDSVENIFELFDRHFGLEIALTVQGSCLDEGLVRVGGSPNQNAIGRNHIVVVDLDHVTDSNGSKSRLDPLLARVKLHNGGIVDCLVLFIAFHLSDEFLKDTERDNETKGNQSSQWRVSLNLRNALHNSSYAIENIDDLGELKRKRNWEEIPPGVSGRSASIARIF